MYTPFFFSRFLHIFKMFFDDRIICSYLLKWISPRLLHFYLISNTNICNMNKLELSYTSISAQTQSNGPYTWPEIFRPWPLVATGTKKKSRDRTKSEFVLSEDQGIATLFKTLSCNAYVHFHSSWLHLYHYLPSHRSMKWLLLRYGDHLLRIISFKCMKIPTGRLVKGLRERKIPRLHFHVIISTTLALFPQYATSGALGSWDNVSVWNSSWVSRHLLLLQEVLFFGFFQHTDALASITKI